MQTLRIKKIISNILSWCYRRTIPKKVLKLKTKRSIRVLFIVNDISKWKSEELYLKMLSHDRFEPIIGLTLRMGEIPSVISNQIKIAINYLNKKNYNYVELTTTLFPKPDIVIYSEPYGGAVPKEQAVYKYLRSLFINIPYSCHTTTLAIDYYSLMNRYAWIDCYESNSAIEAAYRFIGHHRKNIILTGLPMSDILLKPAEKNPWKIQKKNKKKIIWAPHHSLGGFENETILYGNFLDICDGMFEIAKMFINDIQIAFKPHPLLKEKLDVIWGIEKADNYYHRWESLENGQLEEGVYIDLFKYSDAMIHDSSSFIVEYQYMRKPILFITKNTAPILRDLNEFGIRAFNAQEIASDISDIKAFIINIIKGIDTNKEKREELFVNELLPPLGNTACQNIINKILQ